MKLEHSFDVPIPMDEAWPVLLDIERIAPCMPGAELDGIGDGRFLGKVRVKAGPITVSYRGEARFATVDKSARRVVIKAQGKEARGSGSVSATITAQLRPLADSTAVDVVTDLAITGKPAQFGRAVLEEIGGQVVDRFARNLGAEIASPRDVPQTDGTGGQMAQDSADAVSAAGTPAQAAAASDVPFRVGGKSGAPSVAPGESPRPWSLSADRVGHAPLDLGSMVRPLLVRRAGGIVAVLGAAALIAGLTLRVLRR